MRFHRRPALREHRSVSPVSHRSAGFIHELRRGHRLLEQGVYQIAEKIFMHLAGPARQRCLPQAPFLLPQAARPQLGLHLVETSCNLTMTALIWLEKVELWPVILRLGKQPAEAYSEAGHLEQGAQIQSFIDKALARFQPTAPQSKDQLTPPESPAKCSYYGTTHGPGRTGHRDDGSAFCARCESRIVQGSIR